MHELARRYGITLTTNIYRLGYTATRSSDGIHCMVNLLPSESLEIAEFIFREMSRIESYDDIPRLNNIIQDMERARWHNNPLETLDDEDKFSFSDIISNAGNLQIA